MKRALYRQYRENAKRRGHVFDFSMEEAEEFFQGACFYCGCPPSSIKTKPGCYGSYTYNGIDRLDNEGGYTKGNCVSSCRECNYKKGAQSVDDFLEWVHKVASNHSNETRMSEDDISGKGP